MSYEGTLTAWPTRLPVYSVAASSAGFDVVCGVVIEPQPDAPTPPYAAAMAVADLPFEGDVSLDRRPHTSDHTRC
jgi:hypothetical protein